MGGGRVEAFALDADTDVSLLAMSFCDVATMTALSATSRRVRVVALRAAELCVATVERTHFPAVNKTGFRRWRSVFRYLFELVTPRIYVLRGFIAFSFDMANKRWTRLPDLLRDRGYFQTAVLGNEIYAIGTYSIIAMGTIEKYNFLTNQWSSTKSMPRKIRSVAATMFNGSLHILGGVEADDSPTSTCYALDQELNEWVPFAAPMLRPRFRHCAVEHKGALWVAGGNELRDGYVRTTSSVEVYRPETGWVEGPSMQRKRDFFNLLVVAGRMYAVGGDVDESGNQTLRTIEVLVEEDEEVVHWQHITDFPNARRGFSTCAGDGRLTDEQDHESVLSTWDAYDTHLGQWESSHASASDRAMPLIDNWGQAVTVPPSTLGWSF